MTNMKTAVITGASGDIGREIATAFAKNGYNIAALYNSDQQSIDSLICDLNKLNVSAKSYQADISDEDEVKNVAKQLLSDFGSVSVIVNNAGISLTGLVTDFTTADFDKCFGVNVKGMFMLNNALLPSLINQKRGAIINISSIWGEAGASCEVLYSASKAAVIGYTKALAKELGPSNIRVNAVTPGFIDTKMNNEYSQDDINMFVEDVPLNRIGTPDDVAKAVLFLADENGYITGQIIGVNGGYIM